MGFYTNNILTVTGKIDEVKKFHTSFTTNSSLFSTSITLKKLYPVPEELLGNNKKLDNWCDDNWGLLEYFDELECDKLVIDTSIPDDITLEYHFMTKSFPPFLWIDYVSEKFFPNLQFRLEYDETIETSRGQEKDIRCSEEWNWDNSENSSDDYSDKVE